MKNLIFILLFFLLSQCGYSKVYNDNTENFSVNVLSMNGDSEINNLIKKHLKKYKNSSEIIFEISYSTDYKKSIITKDDKGVASDYKLNANTEFLVAYDNEERKFYFTEKINIKNISNSFELKKYEKIIKNNFAKSIKEKLILKLTTIK